MTDHPEITEAMRCEDPRQVAEHVPSLSEDERHELECLRARVQQIEYPCSPHCDGYLRELALRNAARAEGHPSLPEGGDKAVGGAEDDVGFERLRRSVVELIEDDVLAAARDIAGAAAWAAARDIADAAAWAAARAAAWDAAGAAPHGSRGRSGEAEQRRRPMSEEAYIKATGSDQ